MTISNRIIPAHILRLYIWDLFKNNTGLQEVNGLVPIVPIEDEPKLEQSGQTYFVYGFAESQSGPFQEIKRGIFSLRYSTQNFSTVGEITTTISRAFENSDHASKQVNLWSSNYGGDSVTDPLRGSADNPFIGIRFTSLEVTYTEGGEPPDSEGAPIEGIINIGYNYISLQTVKQFRPAGTRIRNINGTYTTTTQDEWV